MRVHLKAFHLCAPSCVPFLRASEWLLWMDDDAIFTDMNFTFPFDEYATHSLLPGPSIKFAPYSLFIFMFTTSVCAGMMRPASTS